MDGNAVPFLKESYQKNDIMDFSAKPSRTVKEFEHFINKQVNILETVCGVRRGTKRSLADKTRLMRHLHSVNKIELGKRIKYIQDLI